MKDYDLRLAFIEGEPHFVAEHAPAGSEDFTFRLKFRMDQLGTLEFDHWWMDTRSIYRTRKQGAKNFDPLVKFWWRSCRENGTDKDAAICQSYLLTKLFDRTRSNGSRNVLIDSIPSRGTLSQRNETVSNLEEMLSSVRHDEKSILEFSRETANHIGPPNFPKDVFDLQSEFNGKLFESSVPRLIDGDEELAIESANTVWQKWTRRFGRRSDCKLEKDVMDILSYESRATIHRCYSHLWELIVNWLYSEKQHTKESFIFHRFWHLDLFCPSNEFPDRSSHFFHGHILGLHPATGFFMRTQTGKSLVGEWLSVAPWEWPHTNTPESPELRRLLNGLLVAVIEYSGRHDTAKYLRPTRETNSPLQVSNSNAVMAIKNWRASQEM